MALAELAARVTSADPAFPRVDEVPFDSDRRRMSTLYRTPQGLLLYAKGALETLLPLCAEVDTDTDRRADDAGMAEPIVGGPGDDGTGWAARAGRRLPPG